MIDLSRCYFNRVEEMSVKSGVSINVEGAALTAELASGEEVVLPSDGGTSDPFIGVSMATTILPTITSHVEIVTIPAAPGPYVVTLEKNNIYGTEGTATGEIFITASTTGALTNTTGGVLATGTYQIVYATGIVTFHEDQTGELATCTYRYSPTVAEAIQEYYQGYVNNFAHTYFGKISVGKAPMRVYTDQFVASINWAGVGFGTAKMIAGGLFSSSAGTGTTLSRCRVIHVPNEDIPFLGLQFEV